MKIVIVIENKHPERLDLDMYDGYINIEMPEGVYTRQVFFGSKAWTLATLNLYAFQGLDKDWQFTPKYAFYTRKDGD